MSISPPLGAALCWLPRASCVRVLPMHRRVTVLVCLECPATRSRAGRNVAVSPKVIPVCCFQLERDALMPVPFQVLCASLWVQHPAGGSWQRHH